MGRGGGDIAGIQKGEDALLGSVEYFVVISLGFSALARCKGLGIGKSRWPVIQQRGTRRYLANERPIFCCVCLRLTLTPEEAVLLRLQTSELAETAVPQRLGVVKADQNLLVWTIGHASSSMNWSRRYFVL
jgi:hypothetical protein